MAYTYTPSDNILGYLNQQNYLRAQRRYKTQQAFSNMGLQIPGASANIRANIDGIMQQSQYAMDQYKYQQQLARQRAAAYAAQQVQANADAWTNQVKAANFYNQQQQQQKENAEENAKYKLTDYNNGEEFNSLADLINVGAWKKNGFNAQLKNVGEYFENHAVVNFVKAGAELLKGNTEEADIYAKIGLNNGLVAFGEDLDILANFVKALTTPTLNNLSGSNSVWNNGAYYANLQKENIKATLGLSDYYGIGNRVNFDYDIGANLSLNDIKAVNNFSDKVANIPVVNFVTGFVTNIDVADLFFETISDPLNLIEMGIGDLAKSGIAKSLNEVASDTKLGKYVRSTLNEATDSIKFARVQQDVASQMVSGKSLEEASAYLIKDYNSINKILTDNNKAIKYTAEELRYLEILKESTEDNLFNNVVKGLTGVTQVANRIDKGIVHLGTSELGFVHPVELLYKNIAKGSNPHLMFRAYNKVTSKLTEFINLDRSEVSNQMYKELNLHTVPVNKLDNTFDIIKKETSTEAMEKAFKTDVVDNLKTDIDYFVRKLREVRVDPSKFNELTEKYFSALGVRNFEDIKLYWDNTLEKYLKDNALDYETRKVIRQISEQVDELYNYEKYYKLETRRYEIVPDYNTNINPTSDMSVNSIKPYTLSKNKNPYVLRKYKLKDTIKKNKPNIINNINRLLADDSIMLTEKATDLSTLKDLVFKKDITRKDIDEIADVINRLDVFNLDTTTETGQASKIILSEIFKEASTYKYSDLFKAIAKYPIDQIQVYKVQLSVEKVEQDFIKALGLDTVDGAHRLTQYITDLNNIIYDGKYARPQLEEAVAQLKHWSAIVNLRNDMTSTILRYTTVTDTSAKAIRKAQSRIADMLSNKWRGTDGTITAMLGLDRAEYIDSIIESIKRYDGIVLTTDAEQALRIDMFRQFDNYLEYMREFMPNGYVSPNASDTIIALKNITNLTYFSESTGANTMLLNTELLNITNSYINNMSVVFDMKNLFDNQTKFDYFVQLKTKDDTYLIDQLGCLRSIEELCAENGIDKSALDSYTVYGFIKEFTNGSVNMAKRDTFKLFNIKLQNIVDIKELMQTQSIATLKNIDRLITLTQHEINTKSYYYIDAATFNRILNDEPMFFKEYTNVLAILDRLAPNEVNFSGIDFSKLPLTDEGIYSVAKYLFNNTVDTMYDSIMEAATELDSTITKHTVRVMLASQLLDNGADIKHVCFLLDPEYVSKGRVYRELNDFTRQIKRYKDSIDPEHIALTEIDKQGSDSINDSLTKELFNFDDFYLKQADNKFVLADGEAQAAKQILSDVPTFNMFYTVKERLYNNIINSAAYKRTKAKFKDERNIAKGVDYYKDLNYKDAKARKTVVYKYITEEPETLGQFIYRNAPGFIVIGSDTMQEAEVTLKTIQDNASALRNAGVDFEVVDGSTAVLYLNKNFEPNASVNIEFFNTTKSSNIPSSLSSLGTVSKTGIVNPVGISGNITNTRYTNRKTVEQFLEEINISNKMKYSLEDFDITIRNSIDNQNRFTFKRLSFDNTFYGDIGFLQDLTGYNPTYNVAHYDEFITTFVDNISNNTAATLLFNQTLRPRVKDFIYAAEKAASKNPEGEQRPATPKDIAEFFNNHKEYTGLTYTVNPKTGFAEPQIVELTNARWIEKNLDTFNPIIVTRVEATDIVKGSYESLTKKSIPLKILRTISSSIKAGYLSSPGWIMRNFTSTMTKAIIDASTTTGKMSTNIGTIMKEFANSRRRMIDYSKCYSAITKFGKEAGYSADEILNMSDRLVKDFFDNSSEWKSFEADYKYISAWNGAGYTSTQASILKQQSDINGAVKGDKLIPSLINSPSRAANAIGYDSVNKAIQDGKFGLWITEWLSKIATDVSWKNPYTAFITGKNNDIEAYCRFFTLEWTRKQTGSLEEAAEHVRNIHFDYEPKSAMEELINDVIPFINFKTANTKYWLELIYDNPILLRAISATYKINGFYDLTPEEKLNDDHLFSMLAQGALPVYNVGDTTLYFKLNGDYIDALQTAMNPIETITDSILGLQTITTYLNYRNKYEDAVQDYTNWKNRMEIYYMLEGTYSNEYKKDPAKIKSEEAYYLSKINYYNKSTKDLLLSLAPFATRFKTLGKQLDWDPFNHSDSIQTAELDFGNSIFNKIYEANLNNDEKAKIENLASGLSSIFTAKDKVYYYGYGNLNLTTKDYEKYINALTDGAKSGWAGVSREVEEPLVYYAVGFSNGTAYTVKDPVKAAQWIFSGGTPLNAEAKALDLETQLKDQTYYVIGFKNGKTYTTFDSNKASEWLAKGGVALNEEAGLLTAALDTDEKVYGSTKYQDYKRTYNNNYKQTKANNDLLKQLNKLTTKASTYRPRQISGYNRAYTHAQYSQMYPNYDAFYGVRTQTKTQTRTRTETQIRTRVHPYTQTKFNRSINTRRK